MPVASKDPSKKIEDLREKIRHHEYRYYVLDDPQISDAGIRSADEPANQAGKRASQI